MKYVRMGSDTALEWISKWKSSAITTETYIYQVHLKNENKDQGGRKIEEMDKFRKPF
jgi:hypothetical protein